MERIARDYPKTGAAKKARQNLGLPEPQEAAAAAPAAGGTGRAAGLRARRQVFDLDEVIAADDEETPAPPEAAPQASAPAPPPKSNLPPGFRKK